MRQKNVKIPAILEQGVFVNFSAFFNELTRLRRTTVQFHPHRYMVVPRLWIYSDKTTLNRWQKIIFHNGFLVGISDKKLKNRRSNVSESNSIPQG